MSFNAWVCEVRLCSPKGSPATVTTLSPSTMPQEVLPPAVNLSQRMIVSLFCRGARLGFPGAENRQLETEIFAQGLAGIVLVVEPAALQFRHDMLDEIGIGTGHDGGRDDKAVAAALDEHLFQPVRDFLRPADDGVLDLAATGIAHEVERGGIGLSRCFQHAVADAQNTLHALELFRCDGLVERF